MWRGAYTSADASASILALRLRWMVSSSFTLMRVRNGAARRPRSVFGTSFATYSRTSVVSP